MTYSNKSCVDACTSCISIAAYCSQQCIEKELKECAQRCLECVEICKTFAVFAARDSYNVKVIAAACAEVCEACADTCEKHKHDHCQECAKACRKCAEECRRLSDNLKFKKSA